MFSIRKLFILLSIFILLLLIGCTKKEDFLTKIFDIELTANSTGNNRLSTLETSVTGVNINLTTSSSSEFNFPFKKSYLQQTISEFTNIDLNVRDNSSGPIGSVFTPYDIEFIIKVDGNIVLKKTQTINDSGDVAFASYSMQGFFR